MATMATSLGSIGCAVGTWASPVASTLCCTAKPTGAALGAGANCTLAVDDVAALVGASICTGATGFLRAGACLATTGPNGDVTGIELPVSVAV